MIAQCSGYQGSHQSAAAVKSLPPLKTKATFTTLSDCANAMLCDHCSTALQLLEYQMCWCGTSHTVEKAGIPLVSFTNPLAAGSGLVERTPKKVAPPPIWSFSSPSFVVQRNTKLPKNWEIHVTVSAPSRMTKSGEEGLLTIVTNFLSEIYFSRWISESLCVEDSEYVPNLPLAIHFFSPRVFKVKTALF